MTKVSAMLFTGHMLIIRLILQFSASFIFSCEYSIVQLNKTGMPDASDATMSQSSHAAWKRGLGPPSGLDYNMPMPYGRVRVALWAHMEGMRDEASRRDQLFCRF
jgi:hypothetical protein